MIKLTKKSGLLLVGLWLVLTGLIPILNLSFSGIGVIMSLLAVVAGVMLVLE